jgi:glutamine synthetase
MAAMSWRDALQSMQHNVGARHDERATFLPKRLVGANGENIFAGDQYAGSSETCLYYIGGIIKHAKAMNAVTNAITVLQRLNPA